MRGALTNPHPGHNHKHVHISKYRFALIPPRYAPSKNTAILANLANRRVRARVLIATASVLLGNPPGGTAHGI